MSSTHSALCSARVSNTRWLVATAVAAAIAGSAVAPAFAADDLDEVTVTGSRIARTRDLEAASPVVTVSTQSFENSATTSVESVLNKLPQFNPAGSQFVSGAQSSPTVTPGAATVDLRGLGINRTLVLIDGRRGQPANATLAIDVNTIPQAAIQGVEVITGGASAVYGPDALAGVVNFQLKKDFQGLNVDLQSGMTEHGGGAENRFSTLMGMNSADGRGNIMVGLDWSKRSAVLMRDRDFYVNGWRDPGNPGGDFIQAPSFVGNPSSAAVAAVFNNPAKVPGTSSQFYFNNDGTPFVSQGALGYKGPLGNLDAGRFTMAKVLTNGNLDQPYTTQFASTPLERHSFFLRGRYDITDDLQAFVQANYSNVNVTTKGNFAPAVTLWSVSVPRDGRALPAALNTLLDSRPNPAANWQLYQVPNYFGPLTGKNSTNLYQMMAGLSGKLGGDWTWEAYYSHGDTQTYAEVGYPSLQRYQMLIAAPNFGKNANITAVPAGIPAGRGYALTCTSGLPVFDEFTPSKDCLDSMTTRAKQLTSLRQDVVEANAQGGLFELPAGEVRGAVGATWRQNIFRFDPGNPVEQLLDNPIGLFASNATGGKTSVKEGYVEALVPIVKNLEAELGYRYSDFNTAGGFSTYKALLSWKALDSLSFRGGYQVATRAPNVAELYAGKRLEVVPFPSVDPCSAVTVSKWGNVPTNPDRLKVQSLCRALIGNSTSEFDTQNFNANTAWSNAYWPAGSLLGSGPNGWTRQAPPFFPLEIETEQGNPNVKPETAKTITLGTVINQPFDIQKLVVTVDYYNIKVTDTIARLSSVTAYNNCFNFNGKSNPNYDVNNYYCSLIKRDPITGDRAEVASLYLNLGTLKTQGVDLAVSWAHDIGPGSFSVRSNLSYLLEYKYQPDATQPEADARGTLDKGGQYKYRLLTDFGYRFHNDFNVGLQWRHLPSVNDASLALNPSSTVLGTGAYDLFNLSAGYSLGKYQLRVGVD
ncbi:MAG: hypothetical protein RLZZ200_2181, partial [Pseudomonadota bacterium]